MLSKYPVGNNCARCPPVEVKSSRCIAPRAGQFCAAVLTVCRADAAKRGLPVPVAEVPPERRLLVALFCYRRSHLEGAALAVAATCDEEDLVHIGGPLGRTLFVKSRNVTSLAASGSIRTTHTANRGTDAGPARRTPNALGSSSAATARCPISTACSPNAAGTRSNNGGSTTQPPQGGEGGTD
jgi:hypothetical protein